MTDGIPPKNASRSKRLVMGGVVAVALLIGVAIGSIRWSSSAGAWPWEDKGTPVRLSGFVACNSPSLSPEVSSSTAPQLTPVEWLTIRGVPDPLIASKSPIREYRTTVSVGWKVEYTLKCKGFPKIDGSFDVHNKKTGSSSVQVRNICDQSPCIDFKFGACALLFIEGGVLPSADEASMTLDAMKNLGNIDDVAACTQAVTNAIKGKVTTDNAVPTPETTPPATVPPAVESVPTAPPPLATVPEPAPQVTAAPTTSPPASIAPAATPPPVIAAPGTNPPPATTASPPPPPRTWQAQQGSRGANTFSNPTNASGQGPRIEPNTFVQVSCKLRPASTIGSAYPDGYWYRIQSAPWNDQFYAVSNTFWNGDTAATPQSQWHNTDYSIPDC